MIDGFDPDKFRKVNKGSKKEEDFDSGIHVERKFGSASSKNSSNNGWNGNGRNGSGNEPKTHQIATMQMPGVVPSYDNSEKQLLASLEQELGVL